jgi:hypothetical protein
LSTADINFILINRLGTAPAISIALKTGTLSPDLKITRIYLRQPIAALGEGNPIIPPATTFSQAKKLFKTASQTSVTPQLFDVVPAKLVVRFETIGNAPILGSPVRELTADVSVAIDKVDKMVDFCHQIQAVQSIDLACDSTHLYSGEPDCPVANFPCMPLYYIRGFDSLGVAICSCETSCNNGASKPVPGAGPPPVPGPGPTVVPGPGVPGPGPAPGASRIGPGPSGFGGPAGGN